ncbi:hypothetical protein BDV96DRAFT_259433 [Lophiotrema nucula]|uniref:Uncharacterized protein n=1 Tax=Lophiotrema nucula TaxID=690887 RepID=A0A6A5YNN1_9PLEO|nr:hypothetical protein BDV96DRAFT_259433 [Lophiotrema nucula]
MTAESPQLPFCSFSRTSNAYIRVLASQLVDTVGSWSSFLSAKDRGELRKSLQHLLYPAERQKRRFVCGQCHSHAEKFTTQSSAHTDGLLRKTGFSRRPFFPIVSEVEIISVIRGSEHCRSRFAWRQHITAPRYHSYLLRRTALSLCLSTTPNGP